MNRISATTAFEDLPALLTVNEAALWIKLHPKYLYRLIADRALPASKSPMRIRKEDLKAWLDKGINPS